jgi:hypothetical protein
MKRTADESAHKRGSGSVSVNEVMTMREFGRRLGLGQKACCDAQRQGLRTILFGRCKFVLGEDVIAWFRRLAEEQGAMPQAVSSSKPTACPGSTLPPPLVDPPLRCWQSGKADVRSIPASGDHFMSYDAVHNLVLKTLNEVPLASEYASEEKDLQPYIRDAIGKALQKEGLGLYDIRTSVGQQNCPRIDLLGTNVWPDIDISINGTHVLAVELKLGRKLASLLSDALGKLVIYTLKYPKVVGFIAHSATDYPKLHEYDEQFHALCDQLGVQLIVRQLGTKG